MISERVREQLRAASRRWAAKRYPAWYEANKERLREKARAYYRSNKERVKANSSRYYSENKERASEWAKQRRLRNPEAVRAKKILYTRTMPSIFDRSKKNALKRGIEWNLTIEQFAVLRKGPCVYCGGELPAASGGLDRIENSIGYQAGNVLSACADCNRHRCDTWTVAETKAAVQAVLALRACR